METGNKQPKFFRIFSFFIFTNLILATSLQTTEAQASNYKPFKGVTFFLLSDKTYSSNEISKIRLEAGQANFDGRKYPGVDINVYRIPEPIKFLKSKKNLHRIQIKGNFKGEGLSNAFRYTWDYFYKKSRVVWQNFLSFNFRRKVTNENPEFRQPDPNKHKTTYSKQRQFKPIPGYDIVKSFRYPLLKARPIDNKQKLSGSSHEFIKSKIGNIYIPIGKLDPGLYFVEAFIGNHRANTILFISNTIALTKASKKQMLLWAINRKSGEAIKDLNYILKDDMGVIKSGVTNSQGVGLIERALPEKYYIIAKDTEGGVFISENYYYDSEIYNTKMYIYTDRPLYRPGEKVHLNVWGREFKTSSISKPIKNKKAKILVLDSRQTVLISKVQTITDPLKGINASFQLPDFSVPGGYTIHIKYLNNTYTGFFRVAKFTLPHFDIHLTYDKNDLILNKKFNLKVSSLFPNSKPVSDAKVSIEVRKKDLLLFNPDDPFNKAFGKVILKEEKTSDQSGNISFEIPASKKPAKYIINVNVLDKNSFRVSKIKEIIIGKSIKVGKIKLEEDKNIFHPKDIITPEIFINNEKITDTDETYYLSLVHLDTQKKTKFSLPQEDLEIELPLEGNYSLILYDESDNQIAIKSLYVPGPKESQKKIGILEIKADKESYKIGDEAKLFLNFPNDIQNAFLTLERDKVEYSTSINEEADWIEIKKITPRLWEATLSIKEMFQPNMTFSVAYKHNGEIQFKNKGIKVELQKIDIKMRTNRASFKPGDKVILDIFTSFKGDPISANLSIGVIDELIYTLQPSLEPNINDFFYHFRKNQVRTNSSLDFYTYDSAVSYFFNPTKGTSRANRPQKIKNRFRRDEKFTLYWNPSLKTAENGRAQISFIMPKSPAKWRINAKAISTKGLVGQTKKNISSEIPVFLAWQGPLEYRKGDHPKINLMAFNNLEAATYTLNIHANDKEIMKKEIVLNNGSNSIPFNLTLKNKTKITIGLYKGEKLIDGIEKTLKPIPLNWKISKSKSIDMNKSKLSLEKNSFNIRINLIERDYDSLLNILNINANYPYGCVEQLSSQLISLSLGYGLLDQTNQSFEGMDQIKTHMFETRARLLNLAGPDAKFSWWGNHSIEQPILTAYAYLADWSVSNQLGIKTNSEDFLGLLKIYKDEADDLSYYGKSLFLWFSSIIGLPTKEMIKNIASQLEKLILKSDKDSAPIHHWNAFNFSDNQLSTRLSYVFIYLASKQAKIKLSSSFIYRLKNDVFKDLEELIPNSIPFVAYLKHYINQTLNSNNYNQKDSFNLLSEVIKSGNTFEKSLSSFILLDSFKRKSELQSTKVNLITKKQWKIIKTPFGGSFLQYFGKKLGRIPFPKIEGEIPKNLKGILVYDSYDKEENNLPLEIKRNIYELVVNENDTKKFTLKPITGQNFMASKLYLDEVIIKDSTEKEVDLNYSIAEIPLPPGSELEANPWGFSVKFSEEGDYEEIKDSRAKSSGPYYSVPIEEYSESKKIYQIIRFTQTGNFKLPNARVYKMYRPTKKGFENENSPLHKKITIL